MKLLISFWRIRFCLFSTSFNLKHYKLAFYSSYRKSANRHFGLAKYNEEILIFCIYEFKTFNQFNNKKWWNIVSLGTFIIVQLKKSLHTFPGQFEASLKKSHFKQKGIYSTGKETWKLFTFKMFEYLNLLYSRILIYIQSSPLCIGFALAIFSGTLYQQWPRMDMIKRSWYYQILKNKRQSESNRKCSWFPYVLFNLINGHLIWFWLQKMQH